MRKIDFRGIYLIHLVNAIKIGYTFRKKIH